MDTDAKHLPETIGSPVRRKSRAARNPCLSVVNDLFAGASHYGTRTRSVDRRTENVAGKWPISSPSTSSGVGDWLESETVAA
jgi:hypothetical protein